MLRRINAALQDAWCDEHDLDTNAPKEREKTTAEGDSSPQLGQISSHINGWLSKINDHDCAVGVPCLAF